MHFDDLDSLQPAATIDADLCIIGSGPAGLTVAREFAGSGYRVVLLESGSIAPKAESDALNEIVTHSPHRVLDQTVMRNRVLGGSSMTWSGRLAAFDDLDFTPREWVANSGWPIGRREIEPYFGRALEHLGGVVPDNLDPAFVESVMRGAPVPDPEHLRGYAWTVSRDAANPSESMRFGPRAVAETMPGIRGYVNATVTHINTDSAGAVLTGLDVVGTDGAQRSVRTSTVVLAAGAIDNARLLLASNRTVAGGVGNAHDQVGRFLMDHRRGAIGVFDRRDHAVIQRALGGRRLADGGVATPGFALAPGEQRRAELLNCAVWVMAHPHPDDPWSAIRGAVRGPNRAAAARSLLSHPLMLLIGAVTMTFRRRMPVRLLESLELHTIVEQAPDPESRVTLAARRDVYGTPLAEIDWRTSDSEARSARTTVQFAVEAFARSGLPEPRLLPVAAADAPFDLPDVAHPTGTTRMSSDPRCGVVDTNCEVHGVAGLYVAGSSVFPTSGHANPTQMIVALAVRLADHLKGTMTPPESGS